MAELGLMGMTIPEEYGGGGTDTLAYAIAVEELTRIDSSVAITVAAHHSLGTLPIYYFGSEEQQRQWLPELASGKKLAAFGLTEANAGSDAGADAHDRPPRCRGMGRRRREDVHHERRHRHHRVRDGHRRHRRRRDLDHHRPERHAGLRDLGADGQARLARVRHARAVFQGARVPEQNLLGPRGEGFKQFLEILDGGRISVAAMGVGLAQGAYDLAFDYAKEREQFGKPIAKFQSVQAKLVDMATEIEAARQLVWKAAWEKDQGRDFRKSAAMAKLFSGELSHRAANWSLQIHGGYGFMDEYAISRLYRDQKILEIGEGTNEVQRMVIARHLGL